MMPKLNAIKTEQVEVEVSEKEISRIIKQGGVISNYDLMEALKANFMQTVDMKYISLYAKDRSYINSKTGFWEYSGDYRVEQIRKATPEECAMYKAIEDYSHATFQYRLSIEGDELI